MKTKFTIPIILLIGFGLSKADAQSLNTYTFASSSGPYTEIIGGIVLGNESSDDQRFVDPAAPLGGTTTTGPGFPIGFNFTYDGAVYDRVAINNNGWVSLGQSSLSPSVNNSSSSSYLPISSIVSISPANLVSRVSALGLDLQAQTGSSLRLETISSAPSRECVIQWKNYREYGSTGQSYNFQIRLIETSNQIRIIYGTFVNNASYTVQVGLRGAPATSATNYHNRTTTTNWSSTAQGSSPTASCSLTSTVLPATGLTFSFNPPTTPQLAVVPGSLAFGYVPAGGISGKQIYTLSGNYLTGSPISINATPGFEISFDSITYSNSLILPFSPPILPPTVIYVRFSPTAANTEYTGTITNSGGGASVNVSVTGTSWEYRKWCTCTATSVLDEDIFNVTIGSINNSSDCTTLGPGNGSVQNLYSNYYYDVAPADLQRLSYQPFSVQIGTCGTNNYNNAIKIFIDYNQDGDFLDSGETVYVSPALTLGPHTESGIIAVPGDALLGTTMMRIVNVESPSGGPSGINSCGTYSWGETEDYKINILPAPPCPPPDNLALLSSTATTATVTWDENGSATLWDIEYGTTPYSPTGIPNLANVTNPCSIGGLIQGTQYVFYVRANCINEYSGWAGPSYFITSCDSATVPYIQNFDNVTAPAVPTCITVSNNNADAYEWKTYATNPHSPPNAMYIRYNVSLPMDDWFFTPGFQLTGGITYNVSFFYRASMASYPERLEVKWGTAPNAGSMTGGLIWNNASITNNTYQEGKGSFTPAADGIYYVGWHGYSATNMYYLYVDNISISPALYSSVVGVYTSPEVHEGDTIFVFGDCSNPEEKFLLQSYKDYMRNQIMPAQSLLILEGIPVPDEAWYGGFVRAKGAVRFEPYTDALYPQDTIRAYLDVVEYIVYTTGYDTIIEEIESRIPNEPTEACDPCKFAILISGGVNTENNHPHYFKELADLYKFKTEKQNYCPENVMVHYFQGTSKDTTKIPQSNVKRADKTTIKGSFDEISRRVRECSKNGQKSTFQKMVTNHGASNGKICLLAGESWLSPNELKGWQQQIIDSCCSTVYDEFLQCFAGHHVDATSRLNNKYKATVFANSVADRSESWSSTTNGSIYLSTKIKALSEGKTYTEAVRAAKLAYDNQLRIWRDQDFSDANKLSESDLKPDSVRLARIAKYQADAASENAGICHSRNVIITPMGAVGLWNRLDVPPGGQVVATFNGPRDRTGNVSVYKQQNLVGLVKIMELNSNVPGCFRYATGNEIRVFNGDEEETTTFWIRNDDDTSNYIASVNGNQNLPQSMSNANDYAGFSFGGDDNSASEFTAITEPYLFINNIDQLPFELSQHPSIMGSGNVEMFGCSFDINPADTLWTQMQLKLDIAEVFQPGILKISCDNNGWGPLEVNISGPGIYTIPLGDLSQSGSTGFMTFLANDMPSVKSSIPVSFSFDTWGLYSLVNPPLGDVDYGDAPDPAYPTLVANDGARHLIANNTYLGNNIDGESDGQPTAQSSGDDQNLSDDENGVTFLWPLQAGNPCKIKVSASIGDAVLNLWIDYDGNGSWGESGEQVFTDLNLVTGDNYLTFILPSTAVAGLTHARFRFSHQPALSYTGYAFDGEVEDYMVSIIPGTHKWQQLPDLMIPGIHAHDNVMAADDFMCNGGVITQIGWWGNYELNAAQQEKRGLGINHFLVNLYMDANCLPSEPPIMSFIVPFSQITESNTGMTNNEGCPVYYYAYNLPFPYPQFQGTRYWISIMALPNNSSSPAIWRWQEANRWYYPVLCGAATRGTTPPWQTIQFGMPVKSVDLAFHITSAQATTEVDPDPADSFVQNEISLAIVPGSIPGTPAALVAAYNDEPYPGGPGLGVSHSFDGGVTWTAQQLPYPLNPSGIPFLDAFDPTATADGNGNVYVAHISTDYDWINGQESGLYIHKSTDGGVNWTGPFMISYDPKPVSSPDTNYRFNDRCQIIADINPASPFYNNLYAVWIKDRGWQNPVPESDIYFSSSSDGGITWTPMLTINQRIHNLANMPNPAIAPDGTIYVCWMDYNVTTGGMGTIFFNKSSDGGWTWLSSDTSVISIPLPPLRLNGGTDVLAKGAPVIETSSTNSQELYLVFAQFAGIDESDIAFGKSTDGGQTWVFNPKINDDLTMNDQILPWMNVKPNGTIDVIWYDRRNDLSDLNWDVYLATSLDGGNSFLPNVKVNTTSAPTPMTPISGLWMGEYPGLAVDNNYAYIAYTSSLTDSKGDILFNRITNPTSATDYGDAPDPLYPTLKANNGASHAINPIIFLGNAIDPENDGLPNALALGDDFNNLPDEDGVVFNTPLNPGQISNLTIQVSASNLFLQGWIDFNQNGSWGDPGEQILTDVLTNSGSNSFSFNVPAFSIIGNTCARFRVSTLQGLSFTGAAPDGEVEDYFVEISIPMDYGDAPDPTYPTLKAGNGASHTFVPGVFMGNQIDLEADGLPNSSATGDNINNLNDEDGVVFNTPLIPGQMANLTVISSVGFFVQGWIDFNADGDWLDAGEQILLDAPVIPGPNPFPFLVPSWTTPGPLYARFRLCSMPGLSFFGPAPDGEVEDYMILSTQVNKDFGDAPDPSYPTLSASMGASHWTAPGILLGASVDTEPDGQPNPTATGDDMSNMPDEDGVIFNTPIIPGQVATLTLLPSAPNLFVQGWIDFDGDGSWSGWGEQILTNLVTTSGANLVPFNVPPYAMPGSSFARFRISTQPGLYVIGIAPDGEVEDYQVTIETGQPDELDFGDAPDPTYPTLLANDGARHILDGVTYLGGLADSEPDGNPDPFALGDDLNNLPDEDGVIFNWPLLKGSPAKITVIVSGGGLFNGWIDFDRDGTWSQSNERIFADFYLPPGTHELSFTVPPIAMTGPSFARFRLSNQPGLMEFGLAYDGEVEDYQVDIVENPELKWQQLPAGNHPGLHSHDYINVLGNYEAVTKADDWQCNGGRITDIHWWGNYEMMGLIERRGAGISHFRLSIHLDNPTIYCLPLDPEVWSVTVPYSSIAEQFTGLFNNESCRIYKYEYVLPVPFDQIPGTRYWLEVTAVSVDPNNPAIWRWQEAMRGQIPILCGATEKVIPFPATWYTILWTGINPNLYSDMAFAITNMPDKTLNLKLYLEGLYAGGGVMNKAQDENGDHFAADTADLVTIELHNALNYATIEHTVSNVKLSTSGLVSISGIPYTLDSSYYITGKHRNSIETTSASPVPFSGNAITYDFTPAASQAYGNNQLFKIDAYTFYGGDVTQDGLVDSSDMIPIDNDAANFVTGYVGTDVNGDGLVDSSDMIIVDNNSSNFVSTILP